MKVILVARKALAAYLISSAVRRSVNRIGELVEIERTIDFRHHLARARVVAADHDAVGMLEILDGGAFAQEFRVGHDREVGVRSRFANDALDLVAGADRHGRLGDDDREAVERGGDLARGIEHVGEIGMAVAAPRRRADRDEHRVGGLNRAGQIAGEFEAAGAGIGGDQIVEARLIDRNFAPIERGDLARVLVDAGHLVAEIGKAGPGNEADIAGADHGNAHFLIYPPGWLTFTAEADGVCIAEAIPSGERRRDGRAFCELINTFETAFCHKRHHERR